MSERKGRLQPNRRDFLRIGGLSLCGVTVLDVLRARAQAEARGSPAQPGAMYEGVPMTAPETDRPCSSCFLPGQNR
jgi:hypothetical protein